MPLPTLMEIEELYELPGEAVFPESIGLDARTGDAYVGSLTDGTLYRLPAGTGRAEVWSPGGADGRCSVAGVKVDARGRLWAAGGYDGTLRVLDLADARTLACRDVGARPSCVNDIAFGRDGDAYVTDSFVPTLFRVDAETLDLSPWVDLAEQGIPWGEGLNLNGIVLAADGRHLVACQTNLGRLWRIGLATARVEEIALEGGPIVHCDGLVLRGTTLMAAINARGVIAVVALAEDASSGRLVGELTSEAFAFPTALAVSGGTLLVVNAQLDRMATGRPRLPFTVVAVAAPEG
ncbi:MAG: superoxide dismutase copper/zinc binding protein [Solirubrobacterales bacterium]|jgi:Cu-Zn family superoxide dismutase|nr:superoxide dismutase copper/zinc binding protein [Solirubrobacterales bacterium]